MCDPIVDKQSIILLRYHTKAIPTCTERPYFRLHPTDGILIPLLVLGVVKINL